MLISSMSSQLTGPLGDMLQRGPSNPSPSFLAILRAPAYTPCWDVPPPSIPKEVELAAGTETSGTMSPEGSLVPYAYLWHFPTVTES